MAVEETVVERVRESKPYEMWLSYDDGNERIHFPVNPEKITLDTGDGVKTVDVVGLGEILMHKDRPAYRWSFSSFLPANTFPGINFRYVYSPYTIKAKLQSWKDADRVCHFIVSDIFIWAYVKISKLKWSEEGGDAGTQYFDIELTEYRRPTIRKIEVVDNTGYVSGEERYDDRAVPDTYTVVHGDCLWSIAQSILGDGSRWKEIYNLNTDIISSDNIIYTGQVLKLPT